MSFVVLTYTGGSTAFDDDEVENIEISPQVSDDLQRLQNNLPIIYKKPDAKKIILNLYSQCITKVEALRSITTLITMTIYRGATLLHTYLVKLDRESAKSFGLWGGVPFDTPMELIFYETEDV